MSVQCNADRCCLVHTVLSENTTIHKVLLFSLYLTENILPLEPLCQLSAPGNITITSLSFFSKTMTMYLCEPQVFLVHQTGHCVVFNDSTYAAINLHGSQAAFSLVCFIYSNESKRKFSFDSLRNI